MEIRHFVPGFDDIEGVGEESADDSSRGGQQEVLVGAQILLVPGPPQDREVDVAPESGFDVGCRKPLVEPPVAIHLEDVPARANEVGHEVVGYR